MRRQKAPDDGIDPQLSQANRRIDPQKTRDLACHSLDGADGGIEAIEYQFGIEVELPPLIGWRQAPGAALKQPHSQVLLELGQQLADRRLRRPEFTRCR
jgi:hypothetical protein